MADASLDVLIRAVLDAKGFDDLQSRLKETSANADAAKATTNDFSAALSQMGSELLLTSGLVLGAGAAVGALKSGLTEIYDTAIEAARALGQFDAANELLGGQLGRNTAANREWLQSLELQSGLLETDLIPAYIRFVAISHDAETAQRLTTIAANAAKAGVGELSLITQALTKYWETGTFMLGRGGAALKELTGGAKDTSTGLQNLEKNVAAMAGRINNLGFESDQLSVRWHIVKENLSGLSEAFLKAKTEALEVFSRALGGLAIAGEYISGVFQKLNLVGTSLFAGVKAAASGNLAEMNRVLLAMDAGLDKIEIDTKLKMAAIKVGIESAWSEAGAALNKEGGPFHPPPQAGKELEELRKKYENLAANAVKWGMEEVQARLAVLKVYQQMANDPAVAKFPDLQAEANKRLVESVHALGRAVASNAEFEVREQKALEKQNDETARKWLEHETKRVRTWRKDRDDEVRDALAAWKTEEKGDQEYTVAYINFLDEQVAHFAGSVEMKRRLDRMATDARIGLVKEERAAANDAANEAVTQLGELFGIQKEVSIANALIHTYAGAARALEDYAYPYSLIVAALTIVAGLAQVANIEKTGAGGGGFSGFGASTGGSSTTGFDDPQNDFSVVAGGRKWAKDMIGLYTGGAQQGFREAMGAYARTPNVSNVTNRNVTTHASVNISGFDSQNKVWLQRFVKEQLLPVMNRVDPQRTLR